MGGEDRIDFTGSIALPEGCDALDAHVVERDSVLTVQLQALRTSGHGGPCDPSDRWVIVEYAARVTNLQPQRDRIRILYQRHVHHTPAEGGQDEPIAKEILFDGDVPVR